MDGDFAIVVRFVSNDKTWLSQDGAGVHSLRDTAVIVRLGERWSHKINRSSLEFTPLSVVS
ncbi:hypothetical protein DV706_02505 [Natronorubrum bangense]|uniref:Uncharacterized protein n=2 Tax=Natronorubrum bangense TaxID=61858 RepID=L9WCM6_9EURY|nr:hypothetical protein C494_12921 [Natronorubrum bangense JCM 10635]QCC53453.1 hypothetical protein DV706_02505 [Natronorubrum bangense]